jgi:protein phosphatase
MPTRCRLQFEFAAMTDRGLLRPANEDAYVARPDLGLFAVADGVSRSPAGQLAAHLAVRSLERHFVRARGRGPRGTAESERRRLARAFVAAHKRIGAAGERHPQHAGMATTMAALALAGDKVAIAHVGDSRVYRARGGRVARLTMDHSIAEDRRFRAETPNALVLTDPAAQRLLTRVVGHEEPLAVTTRVERVLPGDMLLLCTDGLSAVVPRQILELVLPNDGWFLGKGGGHGRTAGLPDVISNWLREQVYRFRAPDNLTQILLTFFVP